MIVFDRKFAVYRNPAASEAMPIGRLPVDAITLARPVRLIFETVLAPSFVVNTAP